MKVADLVEARGKAEKTQTPNLKPSPSSPSEHRGGENIYRTYAEPFRDEGGGSGEGEREGRARSVRRAQVTPCF